MKVEWIEVNKELPKNGQMVSIRFESSSMFIERVLFSEGRFWKKRIRRNVGHSYNPTHWAAIEKKKTARDLKEKEYGENKD